MYYFCAYLYVEFLHRWNEVAMSRVTTDSKSTNCRVLPMGQIECEYGEKLLRSNKHRYKSVIGFKPTGWAFGGTGGGTAYKCSKSKTKNKIMVYSISYSEHSSFNELREFIRFLRPDKIIPTVNTTNKKQVSLLTQRRIDDVFGKWRTNANK